METLKTVLTVVFSGAFFTFLQFMITRHDSKNDELKSLREAMNKGLEERELTGKERYLEHRESIQKLNEAIIKLTENDTQMSKYMRSVGDGIVGLGHDKLVYLTDKYIMRGKITYEEQATLKAVYEPYAQLGGNGVGKSGFETCMKLPTCTREEAVRLDNELFNKMVERQSR